MLAFKCNCKENTSSIKVNADYGADPTWCSVCNCNLDIDQLGISEELKKDFFNWVCDYGKWLDFQNEVLLEEAIETEQKHNIKGKLLTEKLRLELDNDCAITFVEADIVDMYS